MRHAPPEHSVPVCTKAQPPDKEHVQTDLCKVAPRQVKLLNSRAASYGPPSPFRTLTGEAGGRTLLLTMGAPAAALPTGTVAFLFTDVEGSTQLLNAHPEAY